MPRIALISVETRTRDDVHVRLIGATIDRIEALVHRIEASIDGGLECANALDAVPLILKCDHLTPDVSEHPQREIFERSTSGSVRNPDIGGRLA